MLGAQEDKDLDSLIQEGATLATIQEMAERDLENTYRLAEVLFQEGKYEKSTEYFVFLIVHFPYDPRFHFGLAACLQQQKRYAEAIRFFAHSLLMNASDADAAYRIAECLIELDQLNDAREALQIAIELSYTDSSFVLLRAKSERLLNYLISGD